MADLQNAQIDQSYPSLIKTFDNGPIDGTFKFLSDGAGNKLPIEVSNADVRILSNQIQLTDVAQVNGFAITSTDTAFGGAVDFSSATVTGLPGGAAGLESGTGTDSMQSAASLTTNAASATGDKSIVLGDNAAASRTGAIAIGDGADVTDTGVNQVAIGTNSRVDHESSVSIGDAAKSHYHGVALGRQANAGTNSNKGNNIAIGNASSADAFDNTIAIGSQASAQLTGSVALGDSVTAGEANAVSVKGLETQTDSGVMIKGDGTNAGKLKLYCEDASGAHNVTLEGPAHAGGATYSLKFPNVQSAGTQILEADASGNLAWINTPGGGGGGADTTEGQAITPALATNVYNMPWVLSGYSTGAGLTMAANKLQLIPFYANPGETIGEFYVRVQTAQPGATMNIGLYKSYVSTTLGFKTTMPEYVGDIATGVDVSTTGKKSFTGLNVSLPTDAVGGCYWIAFQSDTTNVALQKWNNWVAAERVISSDIYRVNGIVKDNATFALPTGQIDLSTNVNNTTDLPIDFAWRYKS